MKEQHFNVCRLIEDIAFEDYQLLEGISCSQLKDLNRSALHYWYKHESLEGPEVSPTLQAAFDFGSAFHALVLEGKRTWLEKPIVDRRTKAGKEQYAKFQEELKGKPNGFVTLTHEQVLCMMAMEERLMVHPVASQLLNDVQLVEAVIEWDRGEVRLPSIGRMRMDGLAVMGKDLWIIDLKTCQSVQPEAFKRHALKMLYHWQAAYYLEGFNCLQANRGGDAAKGFLFIAAEKEPPHDVGVFQFDEETLEVARAGIQRAGERLADYKAQRSWPGAVEGVELMSCPRWLSNTMEDHG